jgi:hypothetical protein
MLHNWFMDTNYQKSNKCGKEKSNIRLKLLLYQMEIDTTKSQIFVLGFEAGHKQVKLLMEIGCSMRSKPFRKTSAI